MKRAVIEVRLVGEAQTESNVTIKGEIMKESIIAWCNWIEMVKVMES